jgi:pyruvate dehydrogenase E2 component (dihydrolipoamide acetyltransferase)
LDVSTITGTGTRGKITKADVEEALSKKTTLPGEASGGVTSMPYNGMRKGIGDNMLFSLQNAAQLTGFAEVDVTDMVRFRDVMREEYKQDQSVKISYNDILILAVSRALTLHPIMNSTHVDDEIRLHDSFNIGIAVSISNGLIVPVLRNAHQKGLLQIAREARTLAAKAREGTLSIEDVSGGTFTISNTSMIEIDGFTPILRPPETGILGIGRVKRKPAEYKDEIALRWMTVLSLTYNHCVVDGAPAHSFLATVGRYLQKPYLIMS